MTDQVRATVLVEMFLGLGKEATKERVAYYLRHAGTTSPEVLRAACDAAVLARSDDWVPGPGEIMRHARRIVGERREQARARKLEELRTEARRQVLGEHAQGVAS